jgi:hypothetical protein
MGLAPPLGSAVGTRNLMCGLPAFPEPVDDQQRYPDSDGSQELRLVAADLVIDG